MMIDAIILLKDKAKELRLTPSEKNEKLADQYEFAAEALRKLANEGFTEGLLEGLKKIADSMKARRESKKRHNWSPLSVGEYDTSYTCSKCGGRHMERIDDPNSELPMYGCKY